MLHEHRNVNRMSNKDFFLISGKSPKWFEMILFFCEMPLQVQLEYDTYIKRLLVGPH